MKQAAVRTTVVRAAAAREVASESAKRLLVQAGKRHTASICPVEQVLRGSEVSAGRDLRVSGLRELLGKALYQGVPQGQCAWRLRVRLNGKTQIA